MELLYKRDQNDAHCVGRVPRAVGHGMVTRVTSTILRWRRVHASGIGHAHLSEKAESGKLGTERDDATLPRAAREEGLEQRRDYEAEDKTS